MPERPLPPELIERLKKNAPKLEGLLGDMENVDHRTDRQVFSSFYPKNTKIWGGRVRQMNISKNFPGTELVIKRTHAATSQQIIRIIENAVEEHNYDQQNPGLLSRLLKRGLKPSYELRKPFAYAISGDLIAMAKTDKPSIEEVLGSPYAKPTSRGLAFLKKLEEDHGITQADVKKSWDTLRKSNYRKAIMLYEGSFLILGYEKEKLVFMPLLDLE